MTGQRAPAPTVDPAASDERVPLPAYRVAALAAPALDRIFMAAMRAGRDDGGADLVRRYGGPAAVGFLIDLRTRLAVPGGVVDATGFAAVTRYRDLAECQRVLDRQVAHGMIYRVAGGPDDQRPPPGGSGGQGITVGPTGHGTAEGFAATERGAAFLAELYDLHAEVTDRLWGEHRARVSRLAGALARLVTAARTGAGPAFAAVAPPHEPAGSPPGRLLLNRLATLRYHRADAHAAAWAAAGHTAESVVALAPGPERQAIEEETDRRAGGPYAVLDPDERLGLLADLAALPG